MTSQGRPPDTKAKKAKLAAYEQHLGKNGFAEPLIALLVRLREFELVAGFSRKDAARLAEELDPEGPKMHPRQRVSEQLSPRDRLKPPHTSLSQAYVELFIRHVGEAQRHQLQNEVNALHRAADAHVDAEKQRQNEASSAARRRVTPAELRQLDEEQARVREQLAASETQLSELRASYDQLARSHSLQAEQLIRLSATLDELTQVRDQLRVQEAQLTELRVDNDQLRNRWLRTVAEADRLEAQVAALSSIGQSSASTPGAIHPDSVVRQDHHPDTPSARSALPASPTARGRLARDAKRQVQAKVLYLQRSGWSLRAFIGAFLTLAALVVGFFFLPSFLNSSLLFLIFLIFYVFFAGPLFLVILHVLSDGSRRSVCITEHVLELGSVKLRWSDIGGFAVRNISLGTGPTFQRPLQVDSRRKPYLDVLDKNGSPLAELDAPEDLERFYQAVRLAAPHVTFPRRRR
jgi:hypothetical protein